MHLSWVATGRLLPAPYGMMRNLAISMPYRSHLLVFAVFSITMTARAELANTVGMPIVFKAENGAVIEWDQHARTLRTPYAQTIRLADCSDEFQICLTDKRGFAISYFRNCNDVDDKGLKFHPHIVAALHDHIWMVFDAAPNYMFHYLRPKGLVGIYLEPASTFDFRSLIRDRNLHLDKFDALEYRVIGSSTIFACKMKEG